MKLLFCLIWFCVISRPAVSQAIAAMQTDSAISHPSDTLRPVSVRKGRLATVVVGESVFYAGSMAFLQFIWYKDDARVPFTFYNDAAGYLQVDKFGHAYGAYMGSYLGYHALRWAGVPKKKALLYGGTLGFVLQAPIEIWDGLYEGWGFSWSDIGANAAGTSLFLLQEHYFDEQRVRLKFSFAASPYARQANGYLGSTWLGEVFGDYNGHTYWLSIGLNRIIRSQKIPDWLCLSVGYGANGLFGEFQNLRFYRGSIPETQRYRQFLLSLDIDWTKIKTRRPFLKKVFNSMFMLKIPLPTIEFNTKGQIRGHGMYF